MRKILLPMLVILLVGFANTSFAQKAETIKLEQTEGKFTTETLKLKAGVYVFEVTNNGVEKELGFVIAPKGMTEQKDHIPEAYLQKTIQNGETAKSKEVSLKKGEYQYFCPLNPTPLYTLIVE